MSQPLSRFEEAVFQRVLPRLEAQGFQVFLRPAGNVLPSFLGRSQPDAVAFQGDRKIAIELLRQNPNNEAKIRRTQELVAEHADWEMRLVYAPVEDKGQVIPTYSTATIEDQLSHIEDSPVVSAPAAALLLAWAAFEAAARSLDPDKFGMPEPPMTLLDAMAFEGHVTPTEADTLRPPAKLRNEVVHGRLDLVPTRAQVADLIRITRSVLHPDEPEAEVC